MSRDVLSVTVDSRTVDVALPDNTCADCATETVYASSVAVETWQSEFTVELDFCCGNCHASVDSVSTVLDEESENSDDFQTAETRELYEWIETYIETEDRRPTKSKCVQEVRFDVFEAQELVDTLIDAGHLKTVEERRAGSPLTVLKPV